MKQVHGWAFPDADEFMVREMKPDGSYQAGHLLAALAHVTDWSCAIDGGAHVGTWSRLMSEKFARVIAVEPSPDTYEALLVNLSSFGCANVEAKPVAVGARAGLVRMGIEDRAAALANTGARYVVPGGSIPVETIDSWALPSLGLLKMDIEGSEAQAVRGATETIRRCRPIVIYEDKGFVRRYGDQKHAVAHLLTALGYRELQRVKMDAIWGPA